MFLQRFLFRDIPRSAGLGNSEFQKLSAEFLKVRVLQLSFDVLLKIIIAVVNAKFFFFVLFHLCLSVALLVFSPTVH